MADKSEVIIEQMEDTRKGLANKLEKLEQKISGTVETVTDTVSTVTESVENVKDTIAETVEKVTDKVSDTVETVTESVGNTVETVKESVADFFDVPGHVRNHPWLMLGGSVLAGYLGGRLLLPRHREETTGFAPGQLAGYPPAYAPSFPAPTPTREERRKVREEERAEAEPEKPGLLSRLADQFAPQLNQVKGLALGTLFGALRDAASSWVPEALRQDVTRMINGFTSDLGGQVIEGPLVGTSEEASQHTDGSHREEEAYRGPHGHEATTREHGQENEPATSGTTQQRSRSGGRGRR